MIDLLSLPRRPQHNVQIPANIKIKSGLPINSLPGWEHIPLNRKLPMLKCPGNQVIFSKNKIGQSLRPAKQEFDTSGYDSIPEYNPLHDSNLKTFYANERNLKRLRKNGEITANNDVICNLKDFNEYRQQLHKSQLYYVTQEMNRLESDHRDRLLIANAETITRQDHQNIAAREHTHLRILQRKYILDQKKAERFKKLYEKTLEKYSYIQMIQTLNLAEIQHKKVVRQLQFQKHEDVRNDLQRKQLITLKKLFQYKKERLNKNLMKLTESREKEQAEKQIVSWEKRLAERIANGEKIRNLLRESIKRKKVFIENHERKYKRLWQKVEQDIKYRAIENRKKMEYILNKNKSNDAKDKLSTKTSCDTLGPEFQASFDKLLDDEVCEALNAALDMGDHLKVPFEPNDPIYKAATFIMKHILAKFDKDLSSDRVTFQNVYDRLDNFFTEAKQFVIFRATQIISALQDPSKLSNPNNYRLSSLGRVSFSAFPSTIGMSSYQIHPLIEVQAVLDRKPTPAGSLTSIVIDSTTSLMQKSNCTNLCRNELVFIEHYLTKFKRELIVGIGRRVFAAIHCHFQHKVMDVRQELLSIDRKFLLNQVTRSILSYAINPLNFESNLKLCISALSSDIIWNLQKQLLKPPRDPRYIGKPCIKCSCKTQTAQLCLFCNE